MAMPRLERALVALVAVMLACLAATLYARDAAPEDAVASTSSESRPIGIPVLVVVADGSAQDASVARPAAEVKGGRLLSVPASDLSTAVREALSQARPARILIVGGPSAVSDATAEALRQYTPGSVTRIAGTHRYDTAAVVALSQFTAPVRLLRIISGEVDEGPFGATNRTGSVVPLLLVRRDQIPEVTAAALRELRPERIEVVGTRSEIADATLRQLRRNTSGIVERVP